MRRLRGFTLIELGVATAAIAILMTSVLMGRGFIEASRHAKMVDAIDQLRKAAQTYSGMKGRFPVDGSTEQGAVLKSLGLIREWPMKLPSGYTITGMYFGHGDQTAEFWQGGGRNKVVFIIDAKFPKTLDLYRTFAKDPMVIMTGGGDVAFKGCRADPPWRDELLMLCFFLE
jgi:prepilin-type N-terminal cleavage/methylation domain-containing protein